ncbi:uncharacterized protein N7500_003018 [Penicillium coprophilum]|uniref:uncharacterized protein n=1 Tax=Penicillium coprophilum TaxID=36646 RepID=UPI002394F341|nr:uncharacterized protein N7500_003018 [Penicillium coprophilum]KAJ5170235.1 hypothetical protein N7500_003018 [Penicillium coprophilum]
MATRIGPVSTFKRHHAAFVFDLQRQARVLTTDPQAAGAVSEKLCGLVGRVYQLKDASMAMAVDARGNAYVLAKPYGFYSYNVPHVCNDLVACLLHWADILVNTDGRRTDGLVATSMEGVLATLWF